MPSLQKRVSPIVELTLNLIRYLSLQGALLYWGRAAGQSIARTATAAV